MVQQNFLQEQETRLALMPPTSERTVADNSFAASFTAQQLQEIIEPVETLGEGGPEPGAISTDTRTLRSGQWYLALKGETFDGASILRQCH